MSEESTDLVPRAPHFPEEQLRPPLRLSEDERRFLVEYVESGGEFKASVLVVMGKYNTEHRRWAQKLLHKPDATWYMHTYRLSVDRRVFKTGKDLAASLEGIALSTRIPMKYRMRAYDLLVKILVGTKIEHGGKVEHEHGLKVDPKRGVSAAQIQQIRAQVIGIEVEAYEKEIRDDTVIDVITAEPADRETTNGKK